MSDGDLKLPRLPAKRVEKNHLKDLEPFDDFILPWSQFFVIPRTEMKLEGRQVEKVVFPFRHLCLDLSDVSRIDDYFWGSQSPEG